MEEEEEGAKILRMRLTVQNNRVKEEIEHSGLTMGALGTLTSIHPVTLSKILNLHILPTEDQMISIAIALKKPIDYLFPETLLESVRKNTFQNRTRLLDDEQVKQITGPPLLLLTDGGIEEAEETTEKDMLAEELKKAFEGLTHREQRILTLRFGLEGESIRTLEEIGREFNVNRERIRQIEQKAMRKLRLPEHADLLKLFLPENAVVRKICVQCQRFIDYYYLHEHPDTQICLDCAYTNSLLNTKE